MLRMQRWMPHRSRTQIIFKESLAIMGLLLLCKERFLQDTKWKEEMNNYHFKLYMYKDLNQLAYCMYIFSR